MNRLMTLTVLLTMSASFASCANLGDSDSSTLDLRSEVQRAENDPLGAESQAARVERIRRIQSDAGAAYQVIEGADFMSSQDFSIAHPMMMFEARFQRGSVELGTSSNGGRTTLRLHAMSRGASLEVLRSVVPQAAGNRISYEREGVEEWYLNGPLGLEQGFTLSERMPGDGPLRLVMQVHGATHPELDEDGQSATFYDAAGREVFRYTDLYVVDATGASLGASLQANAQELSIIIHDEAAVYPIEVDPLIWTAVERLVAVGEVPPWLMGNAISSGPDRLLVGGSLTESRRGAAYLFHRVEGRWAQEAAFAPPLGASRVLFGNQVSLDGDRLAISGRSRYQADPVHIYQHVGEEWVEEQSLTWSALSYYGNGHYGAAMSLSGDTVAVGAPQQYIRGFAAGEVHIFVRSGTMWSEQQAIYPSEAHALFEFGRSVALRGDDIFVGAPNADSVASSTGAVYVFSRTDGVWTERQKLVARTDGRRDLFGAAIAFDGDTLVIGAPGGDEATDCAALSSPTLCDAGSVHVYSSTDDMWTRSATLTASEAVVGAAFGSSLALRGDRLIVGTTTGRLGEPAQVHVFERAAGVWTESQRLISAATEDDAFGTALGLSDSELFIGAPATDVDGQIDQGVVQVHALRLSQGSGCTMSAECVSGFCVDGLCCDSVCGEGSLDDCQACSVASGASEDGVCGAVDGAVFCDDEDPCTADMCAELEGCVHEPILDCTPPVPDAGPEDASVPDADIMPDAATVPDAAADGGGTVVVPDDGCGCAVPTDTGRGRFHGWVLAILGLIVFRRRRP